MGNSREEIYALAQSVLLVKNDDGSFRCPNEDEKWQQAKNFLECMAGEPLPEGADPVELLEEICPGFSEQRDSLSAQFLNEIQPYLDVLPDIQGAMIRALHPEGAEGNDSESDKELLARMHEQSQGFAEMVCQGFEQMERDAGL